MMFLADGVDAEELEASSCILTDVGFFPGSFRGLGDRYKLLRGDSEHCNFVLLGRFFETRRAR